MPKKTNRKGKESKVDEKVKFVDRLPENYFSTFDFCGVVDVGKNSPSGL